MYVICDNTNITTVNIRDNSLILGILYIKRIKSIYLDVDINIVEWLC